MRPRLLVFVADSGDHRRFAVAAALAAASQHADCAFDVYYDAPRAGRHFGGGHVAAAPRGWPNGSLVAGGRHAEQVDRLGHEFDLLVVGHPASVLWPAFRSVASAAEAVASPADALIKGFALMGASPPATCVVLDGLPQGPGNVVTAPYAAAAFAAGERAFAIDGSATDEECEALERAGVTDFDALWVDERRAAAFPRPIRTRTGDVDNRSYAEVTSEIAAGLADWSRGVFVGDPDLLGAHVARLVSLRLAALYGEPQIDALAASGPVLDRADDPAWGRQFDDRDFFALARHGLGLQVVDPAPPFAAVPPRASRGRAGECVQEGEAQPQIDTELDALARAGRLVGCPLFWCGMVREVDALGRIIDLLAVTGLRAGIVVTAESLRATPASFIDLLCSPPERGGIAGQVELLLGSTGRGVAAEALLPAGALARRLDRARAETAELVPPELVPTGWWPLLDAPLERVEPPRIGRREGVPVLWRSAARPPRADAGDGGVVGPGRPVPLPAVRARARSALRALGAGRHVEARRPFHDRRPGLFSPAVADAVRGAGFDYQWTKSGFGTAVPVYREGDFVALPFTAGEWDGWSPFYTVAARSDVDRAARRLRRSERPGWVVSTVDSPLWALSGEVLRHGPRLIEIAEAFTTSPEIVNVLPATVAAYARIIDATD